VKTDEENTFEERFDRIMLPYVDALIEHALDQGMERWEVSDGFLLAAFRGINTVWSDKRRRAYVDHFEKVFRQMIESVRKDLKD
jgi:hypothetical protein